MQYGLLEYSFNFSNVNIGDDIQTLAARQFIPHVDFFINREKLSFPTKHEGKMILNGWYSQSPDAWPPASAIDPLLISIHVQKGIYSRFLTPESRELINKYGPIGARDLPTLAFFTKNEIPAYFSACLTLTLRKDPSIEKEDFILAVDVPVSVLENMKKRTKRRIIDITSVIPTPSESRIFLAESLLALYQKAHCIVTTRLHAALPATALETPVFLIENSRDPSRFDGLYQMLRHATPQAFIKNETLFNLDTPTDNPTTYKTYRQDLIQRCESFTGFKQSSTFRVSGGGGGVLSTDEMAKRFAIPLYKKIRDYFRWKLLNKWDK